MTDRTPEELRQEVEKLLDAAARADPGVKKRVIASRAFALAQEAEAIERIQQETGRGPN